ncbi:MAG: carboxypeptidase-like regulatory domain-containing protein [Gammaproteobacteria bacterium]|nr:carboxypeptidase-like regulatory domain-containing protein [Gammaproteobacteria bacterium]
MQKFAKTRIAALATLVLSGGMLVGCGDDVQVPKASATDSVIVNPVATVTGQVTDAMTNQGVAGVRVILEGVNMSATTDSRGYYKIEGVPASQGVNGAGGTTYDVTLDGSGATGYPGIVPQGPSITVRASASNGGAVGETGLVVAGQDFQIGQAIVSITGNVYDEDNVTVYAGTDTISVELYKNGVLSEIKSVSPGSKFSFTKVEMLGGGQYDLVAKTKTMMGGLTIQAAHIQEKRDYDTDTGGHLALQMSIKNVAPDIAKVFPPNGHDFGSTDTVTVTLHFSEPMGADAASYRDSTSVGGALYEDIIVTYDGPKAGEISKTLTWNTADYSELAVTIDSAAPGRMYTIDYAGLHGNLEDEYENTLDLTGSATAATYTVAYGDTAPTAPTTVAVVDDISAADSNSLGAGVGIDLYWTRVDGANSYKVFRTASVDGVDHTVQVTTVVGANTFHDTLVDATAHNGVDVLVDDDNNAVSYKWSVMSVNGDGLVSAMSGDSNKTLADVTAPASITATCILNASGYGGSVIRISFAEPVVQAAAETFANYTGLPSGQKYLEYDIVNARVDIGYDDATAPVCTVGGGDDNVTAGVAITDVAGNAPGAGLAAPAF